MVGLLQLPGIARLLVSVGTRLRGDHADHPGEPRGGRGDGVHRGGALLESREDVAHRSGCRSEDLPHLAPYGGERGEDPLECLADLPEPTSGDLLESVLEPLDLLPGSLDVSGGIAPGSLYLPELTESLLRELELPPQLLLLPVCLEVIPLRRHRHTADLYLLPPIQQSQLMLSRPQLPLPLSRRLHLSDSPRELHLVGGTLLSPLDEPVVVGVHLAEPLLEVGAEACGCSLLHLPDHAVRRPRDLLPPAPVVRLLCLGDRPEASLLRGGVDVVLPLEHLYLPELLGDLRLTLPVLLVEPTELLRPSLLHGSYLHGGDGALCVCSQLGDPLESRQSGPLVGGILLRLILRRRVDAGILEELIRLGGVVEVLPDPILRLLHRLVRLPPHLLRIEAGVVPGARRTSHGAIPRIKAG